MKGLSSARIDKAFGAAPDARFGFNSSSFVSAYLALMRGIEERAGLMVLVGVAGCGKTTVLRTIKDAIARNRGVALYHLRPEAGFEGLLGSLLDELRLNPASPSREDGLDTLGEFLSGRNTPSVLLVDDAHGVPNRTLIGLAELVTFQRGETESLQVILAGQSRLEERLQGPELDWIADHVAAMVHLEPLMADELADYVVHRLALARSSLSLRRTPTPFGPEALDRLLRYSDGVPGTLNRLCGSALSGSPKHVDVTQVDRAALACGLVLRPGPVAAAVGRPPESSVLQERIIAPQTIAPSRKALRIGYAAPVVIAAGIGGGFAHLAYFGGSLPLAVTMDAVSLRLPQVAFVAIESEAAVDATVDQAAASDAAMPGAEIPADEPRSFAMEPDLNVPGARDTEEIDEASRQAIPPGSEVEPDGAGLQSEEVQPVRIGSAHEEDDASASSTPAIFENEHSATPAVADDAANAVSHHVPPVGEPSWPGWHDIIARSQPAELQPSVAVPISQPASDTPHAMAEREQIPRPQAAAIIRASASETPAPVSVSLSPGAALEPPSAPPTADASAAIVVRAIEPPPVAAPRIPTVSPQRPIDAVLLMARGDALMQLKDPASARLFYERAAAQDHAGAMSAVGRTFDPVELNRLGVFGTAGNVERALDWYRRAVEAGEPGSSDLVARLEERMARRQRPSR